MRIGPSLFGAALGLRQEKATEQSHRDDKGCHASRGVSHPRRVVRSRYIAGEKTGDRGEGGADHAAADVCGHALTRASQVNRVDYRQVVAPEAELRHRHQTGKKNADVQGSDVPGPGAEQHLIMQGEVTKY